MVQASPISIGGRQAFVEIKKTTSRGKFLLQLLQPALSIPTGLISDTVITDQKKLVLLSLQLACLEDPSREEVILKMITLEAKGISVAVEVVDHITEMSMDIEVTFQLIIVICLILGAEVIKEVEGNLVSQMDKILIQLQFQRRPCISAKKLSIYSLGINAGRNSIVSTTILC